MPYPEVEDVERFIQAFIRCLKYTAAAGFQPVDLIYQDIYLC